MARLIPSVFAALSFFAAGALAQSYPVYLAAPQGTPAAVIARLNAEANQILAAPEVRASLAKQAINPNGGTPEVLHAKLAGEVAKWAAVIRKAGIKAE